MSWDAVDSPALQGIPANKRLVVEPVAPSDVISVPTPPPAAIVRDDRKGMYENEN